MQIFYTPEISKKTHTLSKEESKHCIKVLRKKIGDIIHLVDGKGNLFITKLIDDNTKNCVVSIIDKKTDFGKRSFHLHLAVAPTKNNERYKWLLEKTTEIGIDEITPIICQKSERKILKIERMEKVIIAAMKQSEKAFLPKLNKPISWENFLTKSFDCNKYIAHCREGQKKSLKQHIRPKKDILILIGPEGDFSEKEIKQAIKKGFKPVSLGNSRLRTETAAVAACQTINLLNE